MALTIQGYNFIFWCSLTHMELSYFEDLAEKHNGLKNITKILSHFWHETSIELEIALPMCF